MGFESVVPKPCKLESLKWAGEDCQLCFNLQTRESDRVCIFCIQTHAARYAIEICQRLVTWIRSKICQHSKTYLDTQQNRRSILHAFESRRPHETVVDVHRHMKCVRVAQQHADHGDGRCEHGVESQYVRNEHEKRGGEVEAEGGKHGRLQLQLGPLWAHLPWTARDATDAPEVGEAAWNRHGSAARP